MEKKKGNTSEKVKVQKALTGLVELDRFFNEWPRTLDAEELLAAKCLWCRITAKEELKRYCSKGECPLSGRFPRDEGADDDDPITFTSEETKILIRVYRRILNVATGVYGL